MPRSKDPFLSANFTERLSEDGGKCSILACNYCQWTSTNPKRAQDHHKDCKKRLRTKQPLFGQLKRPEKRQQTLQLGILSLSKAKKQKLDSVAALAIYIGARLFALFDNQHMRAFIDLLLDNLYTPPS
jgi:hypothetical protein